MPLCIVVRNVRNILYFPIYTVHFANQKGFSPAFLLSSHWRICAPSREYTSSLSLSPFRQHQEHYSWDTNPANQDDLHSFFCCCTTRRANALDSVPLLHIQRWESPHILSVYLTDLISYANRAARFINAYGQGLTGPEAAWAKSWISRPSHFASGNGQTAQTRARKQVWECR
jgi:hypothetical protein